VPVLGAGTGRVGEGVAVSAKKADRDDMLPIVRLVRDGVAASGLKLRPFAEQRNISYSTLRVYHDPNLQPLNSPPRKETMRELALALDVPLSVVQRAADASVGRVYELSAGPDAKLFVASLRELSPEEQARTKAELLKLLAELDD
jgi:hypothetical protein